MVEQMPVKHMTEVQFFQSPPYYYEYIETKYTHNNVANQKSLRFVWTYSKARWTNRVASAKPIDFHIQLD